jgi:hypothetical protein
MANDGSLKTFDPVVSAHMANLRNLLVIGWKSPRAWRLNGPAAASYPVMEIADTQPAPFPVLGRHVLDPQLLQAVMRKHRYVAWRTALASVVGVYPITDTPDSRQYVGEADGDGNTRQRWSAYVTNGHGGSVDPRGLNASTFPFSLLRVSDTATLTPEIDVTESHFKNALDSRRWGPGIEGAPACSLGLPRGFDRTKPRRMTA